MPSESDDLGTPFYTAEHGQWRQETTRIDAVDAFGVVQAIPDHEPYAFWSDPDSDEIVIGIGAAMRITGLADIAAFIEDTGLSQEFIDPDVGLRGFFSTAFDATVPLDSSWEGYAPVELFVPGVLFRICPDYSSVTVFGEHARFESLRRLVATVMGHYSSAPVDPETGVATTDDAAYESAVRSALHRIQEGEATKIVVARTLDIERKTGFDIPGILQRLTERFPDCFVFAMRPEKARATYLGATPERLVAVQNGALKTEALAGSAPRGVSAMMDEMYAHDLMASEKERLEHALVGEMIEAAITPLCTMVERAPKPGIKKLGNVQHLFTPIRGTLRPGVGILNAITALHPTPAVCGAPREAARQAIHEVESFNRGLYAGALGWIDLDGRGGDVAVAIRSGLIDGPEARLFAGAGIVTGSDPEREARETRLKFNAVLESL